MVIETILCAQDSIIKQGSKGVFFDGKQIVFVYQKGYIYAYINECPHRFIPLEWMPDRFLTEDKQYIICATHGALFNIINGYCIAGPCVGASLKRLKMRRGLHDSFCISVNNRLIDC